MVGQLYGLHVGYSTSYPRCSPELLKYQQIIRKAGTKFKGLAFLAYDKQFCCRTAYDFSISWDQVDLELWMVTFSSLAKPHCLLCSSPYHSQTECPSVDSSRLQPRNKPVSNSTGLQGVLQVPVHSHTSATVAGPLPTPSSTTQTMSPGALNNTTNPPAPATEL